MKLRLAAVSACLLASPLVNAQEPATDFKPNWTMTSSIGGFTTVDTLEQEQGVGGPGFNISIAFEYNFAPSYNVAMGLGVSNFSDKSEFSQLVVDQYGSNVESATSDVTGFPLFAEAFYQKGIPSLKGVQYRAGAGVYTVMGASRSIGNCVDCYEQDISINGGAYLTAGLSKQLQTNSWGVGIRQYVSGDLSNEIYLFYAMKK